MKLILKIFILLNLSVLSPLIYAKNQLYNHYSPYLAMHGDDPVNWMEWGDAALKKARQENKLIFVSSGYFACRWCHVMHRESYINPDIAKILNDNYISVKVDRELAPVLDKHLIDFVQATTGTAGWPLNVFITPDGYPLVGTTYMPKAEFSAALLHLNNSWTKNSTLLQADAKAINARLSQHELANEHQGDYAHLAKNAPTVIESALQKANHLQGGFSEVRQFPSAAKLLALLRLSSLEEHKSLHKFIQLSLDNMQNKGLHDAIAGGFYRYTTDPDWHTPHFEKMLYTNALLSIVYQKAADLYNNPQYQQTALETVRFLRNDMYDKETGAFIASLSAVDDKNIEGGYYLWKRKDLINILDAKELKLADLAWGLDHTPTLDAGVLPMLQMSLDELAAATKYSQKELQKRLEALQLKLYTARTQHRNIPRDHKLLASWNGLTLAALTTVLPHDKSLYTTGKKLAAFLISLWDGKQLKRSKNSPKVANLNDYAAVAWGLIQWGQANKDKASIDIAKQLIKTAWQQFYSKQGWQEATVSLLPQPLYRQHIQDSPIPSAEALLIEASQLAGSGIWDKSLQAVLKNSTEEVEKYPFSYAYLIAVASQ